MIEDDQITATVLLCDAAQAVGGKLYVLGGAWNTVPAGKPFPMALAVRLGVPWNLTNRKMKLVARLIDEDGNLVHQGESPVKIEGDVEVGRPPGAKPGREMPMVFAINSPPITLGKGGYSWEVQLEKTVLARCIFDVT